MLFDVLGRTKWRKPGLIGFEMLKFAYLQPELLRKIGSELVDL